MLLRQHFLGGSGVARLEQQVGKRGDRLDMLRGLVQHRGIDVRRRLQVGAEMAQWLADRKVQCVGFGDGVAIEGDVRNVKPFHDILMAQNCTFLEVLCNLELLKTDTFFISYAPMNIIGLDSCPTRVYAIEGLPGFTR